MLMIGTNYNSFAYGLGYYKPGYGTDSGKTGSAFDAGQDKKEEQLKNLPWNREEEDKEKLGKLTGEDGKKSGKMRSKGHIDDPSCECETCKNRKYQDGSNEMVSFKSAQRIAPAAVAARVRGHEQEHVINAYEKAAQKNGKVIRASVTLHTEICPECGRTYIAGGETNTQIKYYNEENPYQKDLKSADRLKYSGMNADYAV